MVLLYLCVSSECANVSYNVITLIHNTQSTAELIWQFINLFPVKGKPAENVQMTWVKIRSRFNHRAFSVFTFFKLLNYLSVSVLNLKVEVGLCFYGNLNRKSKSLLHYSSKWKYALHSVLTWHDVTKATFTLQALVFNYDLVLRSDFFVSVHSMLSNVADIRFECELVTVLNWPACKNYN